ncbi:uncharacterized protein [Watersipora subatra]|uniref:uncharacterized protein n=1 Tax=Watersipora subatra TaxID=2589382 RepID=UPI00355C4B7C
MAGALTNQRLSISADGASGSIHLKKTVLFGYADLLAVGCRTLLGLSIGYNYQSMSLPEFSTKQSVKCQRPHTPKANQRYFEPFQILDCKFEEFTIVVVNTETPASKCHYIVNHLLSLCQQSKVEKFIVLSCVRVELESAYLNYHKQFENNFNTTKVTTYPSLPGDTLIKDPMLNTIVQLFKIARIPLTIIATVGHKAHYGQTLDCEFAKEAVKTMQMKLARITGLEFDYEFSESLVFDDYKRCHTVMAMYS